MINVPSGVTVRGNISCGLVQILTEIKSEGPTKYVSGSTDPSKGGTFATDELVTDEFVSGDGNIFLKSALESCEFFFVSVSHCALDVNMNPYQAHKQRMAILIFQNFKYRFCFIIFTAAFSIPFLSELLY
jgi:hypothetical protein